MSKIENAPTSPDVDRAAQLGASGPRVDDMAPAASLAEKTLAEAPMDLEASGAWLTWSDGPPALDGTGPASQAAADAEVLLALAQAAADEDVAGDILAELAALAETEPAAGGEQGAPTPGGGNHLFADFAPGELLGGLKPADLLGPSDLYLQAEGDVLRAGSGGDFVGAANSASARAGSPPGGGPSVGNGDIDVAQGGGQQAHGGAPGDSPSDDIGSFDDDGPLPPNGGGQGAGGNSGNNSGGSSGLGDGSNPGQGGSHAQGNNGGGNNPGAGNGGEENPGAGNSGNGNGANSANAGGGEGGSQNQGNNGGDNGANPGGGNGNSANAGGVNGNGNGNGANAGGGNGNGNGNNNGNGNGNSANAGGGNGNGNSNGADAGGGANHSGLGDGSNPGQGSPNANGGNQGQNNPGGGGDDGQSGGFLTMDQLVPPPDVNAQA